VRGDGKGKENERGRNGKEANWKGNGCGGKRVEDRGGKKWNEGEEREEGVVRNKFV